eukprot:gene15808-21414_t
MTDNRLQIIQEQKGFFQLPIRTGITNTVHRWRRDLVAELLGQFQQKLIKDDTDLQRLRDERNALEENLSHTFESLKVTERKEKEARESLGVKESQVRAFDASQKKYDEQIAKFQEMLKEVEAESAKLKLISTHAIKYITEPENIRAFYGFLAEKGIVLEFGAFKEMMKEMNKMTADQLLLSMGDGVLSILKGLDLPSGKADDIPAIPQATIVFPSPFFEVKEPAVYKDDA